MKKFFIILLLVNTLFASKVYTVLMCERTPQGYKEDVYKKAIVLMTEARLYLQKKYKKKIIFEYTSTYVTKKEQIIKLLQKHNARFYVTLGIKKKKSKANLQKVLYNLSISDLYKKEQK